MDSSIAKKLVIMNNNKYLCKKEEGEYGCILVV